MVSKRKPPTVRNSPPKPKPRGRIVRAPETARQQVEQNVGVNRGVYLRRDFRQKPGPKAKTEEEKSKEVLVNKERYKNVGRKRKYKEVDNLPGESKEPCAKRKKPPVIETNKDNAEKILEGK